ncbi:MAG: 3'-5' exonuclease [Pseudoxanthomonas sp.]
MALVIPGNFDSASYRLEPSERRVAHVLKDTLDSGYLCWCNVPVGANQNRTDRPDFIILHPNRGILVLEVKDWALNSIAKIDPTHAYLSDGRGKKSNPLLQARGYAEFIANLLKKDPALVHPAGSPYEGGLAMPWGYGVVLTRITRKEFDQAGLHEAIPSNQVICKDELAGTTDSELFEQRLWNMFRKSLQNWKVALTHPQIERVRWNLFPEIRIQTQGSLFDTPASAPPIEIPDLIKVMDLQQEQLARSLGEGHRVIHGVAGSGKTMILGYRCVELARIYAKPILVLCYNKTLAARLEQLICTHGVQDKARVFHFHGWCKEQLRTYALPQPGHGGDWNSYNRALVESVMRGVESNAIPRSQYAAVLIDEGHDFAPEWLKLVVQMVDPETNNFLLLYDDAQSIYDNVGKRKFTFKSVGIEAQGRTTILKLNYRNTLEVLSVAKAFAEELLTGHDDGDDHPIIAPESVGRRGPTPELVQCRNKWDETEQIARRVAAALDDGIKANDIGVLCYSTHTANDIAAQLQKARIPFKLINNDSKRSMFEGEPSIKVMPMKSSKGLEFDTVFIPRLNEVAAWCKSDSEKEQEARLLYVAMTRSLSRLTLFQHGHGPFTDRVGKAVAEVQFHLAA